MNILKNAKDYFTIKKSGLFDEKWFKNTYGLSDDVNSIKYYLKYGVEKNLNPSKDFNTSWYLSEYEDVKKSGMNPFIHYIKHGILEHRLTHKLIPENNDKFSLINNDYNPCFFNDCHLDISENEVNIAFFVKNDIENLLPTEYIRLVIPFYHLFLKKNFKPYLFNDFTKISWDIFKNIDIIIIQRDALNISEAHFLMDFCNGNNIKTVYEIDDDLLSIDKSHRNYNDFAPKIEAIEYLISNSDTVTVSTPILKEKFTCLNSNIKLIRNSSNDMLDLKNYHITSNEIKIGYMGTSTHKDDVKIIENAIRDVKKHFAKKGINVRFETVGVSDEKIVNSDSVHIPFKYSKYPYFIRWLKQIIDWDIAVAPLVDNKFNNSKSEIKYLEYSSLGFPAIYSNVGSYSQVIKNNENGILVNNSTEEWAGALIKLIEDENLRKKIVKNSYRDLHEKYHIDFMVNSWINLLEELLTSEKLEIFKKPSLKLMTNPLFSHDYHIIYNSKLFDFGNYICPNHDKIYHYLSEGVFEGLNPSNDFDTCEYIKNNDICIFKDNPLVHFIKKFENKFKYNILEKNNIDEICDNLENNVSIIVPIFNAYDETKKCIESILKHTKNYDLVLINDKSTDTRINYLLDRFKDNPNIRILSNEYNRGFTASVNVGLINSLNDVVILNSDTVVTPNWLNKLKIAAYSSSKIATVTPFSNNAGAFSVPVINKKNIISDDLGLIGASNIVEKVSNHVYLRVPTGNGFCMYIKRKSIDSVGLFDEKTFKRGYGEENDFCMRLINKGWENIIDDSTYIFHNDSSSFGSEKQELIAKHLKLVIEKHPTYEKDVKRFINSKIFRQMRINVDEEMNVGNFNRKRVLYVSDEKIIVDDENENFFLTIGEKLELYYVLNGILFKIKGFKSCSPDLTCFNIIINLSIDEMKGTTFDLAKSEKLMGFLK